jgi:hypothetical protein
MSSLIKRLIVNIKFLLKMKTNILTIFIFLSTLIASANENDIGIKGAKGECFITHISPEQAIERALIEAKFDALRKAGIGEAVNAIGTLISHGGGQDYSEVTNIELGGEVIDFSIIRQDIEKTTELNMLTAIVEINATVRKYTKPRDPVFVIRTEGVDLKYEEGGNITFSVTPNRDGYLRIFVFEDNTGELFYPNRYEADRLFKAGETVHFPVARNMDYVLHKSDASREFENNLILFVFLKDDIPFLEKNINMHTFLNWLAKISPDRRTEVRKSFHLYQKKKAQYEK